MRATAIAIAALLAGLAGAALAQTASIDGPEVRRGVDAIRPHALGAHMRFLADDLLEGRGTGTRGYEIAARYVASEFERVGLTPGGDAGTWFQPIAFRRASLVPTLCGVTLVHGVTRRDLVFERDFLMGADTYRRSTDVTADVVFAGYGVTAPEQAYDDFAGIEARGKIVAVLSGAPPRFPHTLRAHYSNGRIKNANLSSHGAIGVLTIRTPIDERRSTWEKIVPQNRMASMHWLDARGVPDGIAPTLQGSATLHRAAATRLFEGASQSLEEVFAAADQGKVRGFALPLKVRLRRASRHESVTSSNVAGMLRGSDPRLAEEVVVISAHLDHLGVGSPVKGDSIYNGAFDNATGIAAMIELAASFSSARPRPRRSLLFLAVTGEEKGLQGSSWFASHPTVPIRRIVADLNLDMYVMVRPLREVVAFGSEHSTLGAAVQQAAARLGIRVVPDPAPEEVVFVRSDQYSFVRAGVPSLFVVGAPGPQGAEATRQWRRTIYHSPQDDLSQPLDLESLARFTRLHYVLTHLVANQPSRPRWTQGDFFGDLYGKR